MEETGMEKKKKKKKRENARDECGFCSKSSWLPYLCFDLRNWKRDRIAGLAEIACLPTICFWPAFAEVLVSDGV
jgi:hypothetical protein